ncbi:hypothetical protein CGLO_16442 [Colletotrichum gloeosporioides Cg-14]|uniref:Uncharacterized protein n=1 Tax=Colletotrichum gloeosporioides (strain Cg-14) TaxID=1237896 RepID=T0KZK9_COLGC|nr:hypothetical protein CGLO_16442 [Colletotrichum gloeosporioides Cg-14]
MSTCQAIDASSRSTFPLLRKQTCTTMRQNKKALYFAQIRRPCLRSVPMRKRDIHGSTPPFLLSP